MDVGGKCACQFLFTCSLRLKEGIVEHISVHKTDLPHTYRGPANLHMFLLFLSLFKPPQNVGNIEVVENVHVDVTEP